MRKWEGIRPGVNLTRQANGFWFLTVCTAGSMEETGFVRHEAVYIVPEVTATKKVHGWRLMEYVSNGAFRGTHRQDLPFGVFSTVEVAAAKGEEHLRARAAARMLQGDTED